MTTTDTQNTPDADAASPARPVNWFEILTPDAAAASAFYAEALGWASAMMGGPIWTIDAGDTRGNFTENEAATPMAVPVCEVASLEETVARIVAGGGSQVGDIMEGPMVRWVHVTDPWGARLGLWQPKG